MGSTTTYGSGAYSFALPYTAKTQGQAEWHGRCAYLDSNTSTRKPNDITATIYSGATKVTLENNDGSSVTNTSPITWANADVIKFDLVYECAS
jgi:hypothetical protein